MKSVCIHYNYKQMLGYRIKLINCKVPFGPQLSGKYDPWFRFKIPDQIRTKITLTLNFKT